MNMLLKPLISPDEFEEMPGTDGYELIDGVLKEKSVGAKTSQIQFRLNRILGNFLAEHDLGVAFDAEGGYICFPHRPRLLRKPDVSFVRHGRLPGNRVPDGYPRIAPDLAVEVVSPNDLWYEVEEKIDDYLRVNVPLIWIINPATRTVHVYESNSTIRRLTESDHLTGGSVLSGFSIQVRDIFPSEPPATADTSSDEQPS